MTDKKTTLKEYKTGLIILGVGLSLILFLPGFISQSSTWLDFSNTGQIGDTIGGITAPISGFIGALLVYIAFHEQVKANNIQNKRYEDEQRTKKLNLYLNNIKRDIEINEHPKDLIVQFQNDFRAMTENIPNDDNNKCEIAIRTFHNNQEHNINRINFVLENILNLYTEIQNKDNEENYISMIRYYLSIYSKFDSLSTLNVQMLILHKFLKSYYSEDLKDTTNVTFNIIYPRLKNLFDNVMKTNNIFYMNDKTMNKNTILSY